MPENISRLPEFLQLLPLQPLETARILKYNTHLFSRHTEHNVIFLLTTESGEVLFIGRTMRFTKCIYEHGIKPHMYIHAICFEPGYSEDKRIVEYSEKAAISFFFPSLNLGVRHSCPFDPYKGRTFGYKSTLPRSA